MTVSIRVLPVPNCPICGARMALRQPKHGEAWAPFWGCKNYPTCDGTRRPIEENTDQPAFWELNDVKYQRVEWPGR
jgi:ssDNA-binding Zn-finger/Zn-ribbon topoisomerase 1